MKWVNHITIAASITVIANPALVSSSILGSTAPDWIEFLLKKLNIRIRHRTTTHYLSLWLFGVCFSLFAFDINNVLFWFCVGGVSHCLTDALTVTGIPLGWWSDRRFNLFGGRLKTGQMGEYFVAFGFVVCAAFFYWTLHGVDVSFVPFFYNWQDLYQQGLIDGAEWKQNRFKVF